jgi:polyisoprenoid-binding protein YceI
VRLTRRTTLLGLAAMAGGAQAQSAGWRAVPMGAYALDPARARITARLGFLGLSHYDLRFTRATGRLLHDGDGSPQVTISLDPRSVERPGDLAARRAVALLEPDLYPTIAFQGRQLRTDSGRDILLGDLTLHGVTRPTTLQFDLRAVRTPPDGPARLSLGGQGRIRRSAFGITAVRGILAETIDLLFDVEFVRR